MPAPRALRELRARRIVEVVEEQRAFYAEKRDAEAIAAWQLERFHEQWRVLRAHCPHYRGLVESGSLPESFGSWAEFRERVPVLDKPDVQRLGDALRVATRPPEFQRITGGTTAEPVQLPGWHSELRAAEADIWWARSWFGVSPADRLFLFWGHSHLLGRGLPGWWNGVVRRVKDGLLGYHRYSAYDLSEAGLRRAAEEMLAFRPAYVIGYAVALDRFARANADRRDALRALGLRVAIATGEAFPDAGAPARVEDVLGCPVRGEYGAVETGTLAHQTVAGTFAVFWRHHHLETRPSPDVPGGRELLVTALYPRCFPLVRYRIGDLVVPAAGSEDVACGFAEVVGRCNDAIELPGGEPIHSEAFTHAIRDLPEVLGYQVVQEPDGAIAFRYQSAAPLSEDAAAEVKRRLTRIHADLAGVELERVAHLERTIAGKTRRVWRKAAP